VSFSCVRVPATWLILFSAGIPQVVLPVWMDTFDFARRAELLGIGRWGNRVSAKNKGDWGRELGLVLIDVILGPRSAQMRDKARDLAKLCSQGGGGRVIAAKMILNEIRDPVLELKDEDMLSEKSGQSDAF
jgi:UDP:flavonoid glycosyltransferase YjiC (YdhE family)